MSDRIEQADRVEHADHVENSVNTETAETVMNADHVGTVRNLELHAAMPLTKSNTRLRLIRDIAVAVMVTCTLVALTFSILSNRESGRENRALIQQLQMDLQTAASALAALQVETAAKLEGNRSDDAEVIECYRRFADAIQLADGAISSAEVDLLTAIATYPPESVERDKFSKLALVKLKERQVLYDEAVHARETWDEGLPCPITQQ